MDMQDIQDKYKRSQWVALIIPIIAAALGAFAINGFWRIDFDICDLARNSRE